MTEPEDTKEQQTQQEPTRPYIHVHPDIYLDGRKLAHALLKNLLPPEDLAEDEEPKP